jgi:hypothetical protein
MLKHKWFVFVECYKMGMPIKGLLHDLSKFFPDEWFPYVEYFYGEKNRNSESNFRLAWLKHKHRNKHHYQYWYDSLDNGTIEPLIIPIEYLREMVCDWKGCGKAQGIFDPNEALDWYNKNKEKIHLNKADRIYVETILRGSK